MSAYPKIAVVIASYEPGELLRRTLQTISEAKMPTSLGRILIAENGPKATGVEIVREFADKIPVEHHFFPNAKKCGALNRSLDLLEDELIIYFDDDIRVHEGTLAAYAEAARGKSNGEFYGGQCRVDCVEKPVDWIVKFLPDAAIGWAPSDQVCEIKKSGALGFNWAAFANDLRDAGGYDERCGPGTSANSDEINVQDTMLRNGVKFYYLPDAIVWHYVPPERCSPEWLLDYKRKDGKGKGIAAVDIGGSFYRKQKYGSWAKLQLCRLALLLPKPFLSRDFRFHLKIKVQRLEGKLEGIALVESGAVKAKKPITIKPSSSEYETAKS